VTVLARDCYVPSNGQMVSFEAARRAALALASPLRQWEEVPLAAAVGRILAAPIRAPRSLLAFDQAAMDGYAVCLAGKAGLPLVLPVTGRTNAGDPPAVLAPGSAHRIMTGAALPAGADTVVMQEHVSRKGAVVHLKSTLKPGANIRQAGEDIREGTALLMPGRKIGWPEVALLAALGVATVSVARPLRVTILTTGSELRDAGAPLSPGAIYDSNGPMLAALLAGPNVQVTALSVGDNIETITGALEEVISSVDLLVTTAGMSVGEEDYVRAAFGRAGGQFDVVKVAMKPGKPLAFGMLGDTCFVGLPGNPQAAAFSALAFLRPMITALLGAAPAPIVTAELAFSCARRAERTELLPVRLTAGEGRLMAHRAGPDGSHRMLPMTMADAVAILPGAATPTVAGEVVEVLPFDGLRSAP
jgi:molybdopterin molybdotransferase